MFRVFGINARFDRMAVKADLGLFERKLFARGDLKLPGDEVDAGDRLGHRVLDLKPRVHFDEPEAVGTQTRGTVGDKLHRAGADIADRLRRRDRGGAHLRPQRPGHSRRGCFLDHLLMPALQRAVALAEMNDIAMPIAEHLNFDVARRCDIFLDQNAARTKRRCGLANCPFERIIKGGVGVDTAHASAAAAGRRLYQDRIADLVRLLLEKFPSCRSP